MKRYKRFSVGQYMSLQKQKRSEEIQATIAMDAKTAELEQKIELLKFNTTMKIAAKRAELGKKTKSLQRLTAKVSLILFHCFDLTSCIMHHCTVIIDSKL